MRRVSGGYTIIEVMIFLAVSAALMASVMNLIKNKQAETDFTQKVRDTQSQLQSWISATTAGFTGADPTQEHCNLPGGPGSRPIIKAGAPGPSYQPNCVFLGEAVQFTDQTTGTNGSTIYAYPVFGVRSVGGVLPTDLRSSLPEPAIGLNGGVDLTQHFNLLPVYVKSVTSSPAINTTFTSSHLVAFYGSINSDTNSTNANGASDINAYQYYFAGGLPADNGGTSVIDCLEMNSTCVAASANYPDTLGELDICLSDGNQDAVVSIISSNGIGGDVTLQYKTC